MHAFAYALVLLVAPVSHAVLEASGLDEVHVESESFDHGQQPHNEYMCQVCRLFDTVGANSHAAPAVGVGDLRAAANAISFHFASQDGLTRLHRSRAPPTS